MKELTQQEQDLKKLELEAANRIRMYPTGEPGQIVNLSNRSYIIMPSGEWRRTDP